MKEDQRAAVTAGRQALQEGTAEVQQDSQQDPEIQELEDSDKQEKIIKPDPSIFKYKVNGQDKELKLYPMPAKIQRKFAGFASKIFADARGKYNDGTTQVLRITGILIEDHPDEFLTYAAYSLYQDVSKIEANQVAAMQNELDTQLQISNFAPLFFQICTVNDLMGKLFGGG